MVPRLKPDHWSWLTPGEANTTEHHQSRCRQGWKNCLQHGPNTLHVVVTVCREVMVQDTQRSASKSV